MSTLLTDIQNSLFTFVAISFIAERARITVDCESDIPIKLLLVANNAVFKKRSIIILIDRISRVESSDLNKFCIGPIPIAYGYYNS